MYSIFAWMPAGREHEAVKNVIIEASQKASELINEEVHVLFPATPEVSNIYKAMENADVLLTDLNLSRSSMYALGYTDALPRPTILISPDNLPIPYAVQNRAIILYDLANPGGHLLSRLVESFSVVLKNPTAFTMQSVESRIQGKVKTFISYSHQDIASLRRLQVHLRPLERSAFVDIWADTRIQAGDKWKKGIVTALEEAAIAVLLISADFLASDFIIENELPPLLAAAEKQGTTILSLILKPCRFMRNEQLSKYQAINNPAEPLLGLNEIEQEQVYAQLADRIEIEIREKGKYIMTI